MKYLAALLLLALSACSAPAIKTTNGYAPGQYRVAQFTIEPSEDLKAGKSRGTTADVAEFKQLVSPLLVQRLSASGQGNPVSVKIVVTLIHSRIDGALAATLGDAVQVWTTVTLTDMQTGQPVGTVKVMAMPKGTTGLIGMAVDSVKGTTDEQNKMVLAQGYADKLMEALYPKK